ncbi:anthranilate synthase family protein, partial [Streptomyces sp. URMC 126]|uniref:anthranilate synthase family protein n=1 Tax=Streptomyces sp. URMC 126 TaxID=3423401 RepID=UPI003F1AF04F
GEALLARVLSPDPPPFALLYRPATTGGDHVDVLTGDLTTPPSVAGLPLPATAHGPAAADLLAVLPYRQLAERGLAAPDDGTPLLALTVRDQAAVGRDTLLARVPDTPLRLTGGHFDLDDDAYARLVRTLVDDEIATGAGANFVLKRRFLADVTDWSPAAATAFFRRLLAHETGVHWTFLVHTPGRTLVGASPERHVTLRAGTAVMNPISGTYRHPAGGPTLAGVLDFLADPKETYELYMVLDEELKMMASVCDGGIRVRGPFLKEMARLAHTEYFIEGRTDRDVRDILRATLFAPTVTGSPLESAARVISRHEPRGRGYYSGVIALVGRDGHGGRTLDSAILIRTADIDARGRLAIGVGATVVRDSDPASEAAETRAKARGLLAAPRPGTGPTTLGRRPAVRSALAARNTGLARFWLHGPDPLPDGDGPLAGRRVLVIDAEDGFTAMIAHQLRAEGARVTVRRHDRPHALTGHDLVVTGPGPGDPLDLADTRIARLHHTTGRLLAGRRPFLAVCLSHQILGHHLGLAVRRRPTPHQGVRKEIDLFGRRVPVGFYNSYALHSAADHLDHPARGRVEVCRDPATGEVHALRGPHFAGVQFHAESVLTRDGPRVLRPLLTGLLGTARPSAVGS